MATIKRRMQAGGTTKSLGKAPDITGDYITVQKRVLGNMKGGGKINRLQKREETLVYKGNKAVDEGRYKKADRLLGRAARVEDRKIRASKEVKKAEDGKWIQKAIKKPGSLRKSLGVKKGETIPPSKLAAAAKKPGKLGQRARLAKTLKAMSKGRKSK